MRYLVLIASLALAGTALAEDPPKIVPKRIDQTTPVLMETAPSDSSGAGDSEEAPSGSRAQDHNSSRSNTTSRAADLHAEGVVHRDVAARSPGATDFGMSRATERRADVANQNSSRSNRGGVAIQPAEGADYNSSRSNKTHTPAAAPNGSSGQPGGTRAQDYNSSRSNTTTLREGPGDLDRDGRVEVLACHKGVDEDCDDADPNESPVSAACTKKGYDYYCNKADSVAAPASPAKPADAANHNTTRSNH
jgi:hypothetical protein